MEVEEFSPFFTPSKKLRVWPLKFWLPESDERPIHFPVTNSFVLIRKLFTDFHILPKRRLTEKEKIYIREVTKGINEAEDRESFQARLLSDLLAHFVVRGDLSNNIYRNKILELFCSVSLPPDALFEIIHLIAQSRLDLVDERFLDLCQSLDFDNFDFYDLEDEDLISALWSLGTLGIHDKRVLRAISSDILRRGLGTYTFQQLYWLVGALGKFPKPESRLLRQISQHFYNHKEICFNTFSEHALANIANVYGKFGIQDEMFVCLSLEIKARGLQSFSDDSFKLLKDGYERISVE